MWQGGDTDAIGPFVDSLQAVWPNLRGLSLDRGFWSPAVYQDLASKLDLAALPKKRRANAAETERQEKEAFKEARRRHPGIESAINMLEQHGMSRVLSYGADGFTRMVGLSVIAANLIRIGRLRQDALIRKDRRDRRKPRRRAA